MQPRQVLSLDPKQTQLRADEIKAILARGNVVCLTNMLTGVVKHIREWVENDCGDLKCSFSTGKIDWACPYGIEYDMTEITKEQADEHVRFLKKDVQ